LQEVIVIETEFETMCVEYVLDSFQSEYVRVSK